MGVPAAILPSRGSSRVSLAAEAARGAGGRLFRQFGHFKSAGAVGEAADEAAFLQGRDQPVNARLGRQIQRLLHLVERGGDAGLLNPFVDEHQQFVLLAREHRQALMSPFLESERAVNIDDVL